MRAGKGFICRRARSYFSRGQRMGAAPGSGWEEGEFEFKLVFEEDPPRQSRCGPQDTESGQTHHEPAGTSGAGVEALHVGMWL